MVTLPLYHICLICTAIESPHQGGLLHQGANKAYVISLPEATYVSQNGLFALLIWKYAREVCTSREPVMVALLGERNAVYVPENCARLCLCKNQRELPAHGVVD